MDDISREQIEEPVAPAAPARRARVRKGPAGGLDESLGAEALDAGGGRLGTADGNRGIAELDAPVRNRLSRAEELPAEEPAAEEPAAGEPADREPAAPAPGSAEFVGPVPAASAPAGSAPDEDEVAARPLAEPGEVWRVAMAVLLTTREAMSPLRLAQACNTSHKVLEQALERLETELRETGMPLQVVRLGAAVKLMTVPEVHPYLKRLRAKAKKTERLSPAALETLAVIAYRQPVIRAEIEAIRGVKVGPTLRTLLDHKLVGVVGRKDVPGRPLQYGTTPVFLDRFGLGSLADLPSLQEFKNL